MNKKGIIILLYSVALLSVLAVILLSTTNPKSFTLHVGQGHAEIVRISELTQNFNSYTKDAALIAYDLSGCSENSNEDFEENFEENFEEIMSNFPAFGESSDLLSFEDRLSMNYNYEYGEGTVTITGIPERLLQYDYYIDETNEIIITEENITDYYEVYSGNFEIKIYPNFELTESC